MNEVSLYSLAGYCGAVFLFVDYAADGRGNAAADGVVMTWRGDAEKSVL